jgi:hypothetical protein
MYYVSLYAPFKFTLAMRFFYSWTPQAQKHINNNLAIYLQQLGGLASAW